jgi:hypothetical protein
MKLHLVLLLAGAGLIAGCATPRQASPGLQAAAMAPLYCEGAEECSRYWRRAQVWVTTNSRWKIQTVTDSVIVTFTPSQGEVTRGYQVTKEPLSQGREQIKIASACANMFGCNTDAHQVALEFKNFVRGPSNADSPADPKWKALEEDWSASVARRQQLRMQLTREPNSASANETRGEIQSLNARVRDLERKLSYAPSAPTSTD